VVLIGRTHDRIGYALDHSVDGQLDIALEVLMVVVDMDLAEVLATMSLHC
jgi:hypothetical protein